jgi:hypothetical protein
MNVCQRPDYLDAIYDNDRRNRPPQSACEPGYNIPSEAFCRLPPSFVAQPFLTLAENGELQLLDGKDEQKNSCGGACRKGPASAILDAADSQFGRSVGASRLQAPLTGSKRQGDETSKAELTECAIGAMRRGEQPWAATSRATRQLYSAAACEPCDLVLSCGDGGAQFGRGCGSALQHRSVSKPGARRNVGVPTLQMPHMDRAAYADGSTSDDAQPLYFQKPISQLDAAGSNNPFLAAFGRHAFEAEKERLVSQYGMGVPPFPKPCPPTPIGVAPRYDAVPRQAREAQPIAMSRAALLASDNCGCNRSECTACNQYAWSTRGTTCAPCNKKPQSVAGIYARQGK